MTPHALFGLPLDVIRAAILGVRPDGLDRERALSKPANSAPCGSLPEVCARGHIGSAPSLPGGASPGTASADGSDPPEQAAEQPPARAPAAPCPSESAPASPAPGARPASGGEAGVESASDPAPGAGEGGAGGAARVSESRAHPAPEAPPAPGRGRRAGPGAEPHPASPAFRAFLEQAFAHAAWSTFVEPGDGVAGMLLLSLGAPTALRAVLNEWPAARTASLIREQGVEGIDPEGLIRVLEQAEARWRPRIAAQPVFRALEAARRSGVRLLLPQDPEWPVGVDDLGHHAPVALWARGGAEALAAAEHSVSLVGARASTRYGEEVTMEITAGLVERGFAIVSGAAYGIDGIAHRACLANHGHTIAVLAGGVDRPYPSGHAHLISRIAREGLIISEIPCGGAPTKWRFLQRNRLIAALGQATIVLEAGWRSGSLNTAAHAATLGRPLGAVPGPVTSATSAGCHRLLREYAAQVVIDADTAAELIAPLNHLPGGAAGAAETPPGSSAGGERPAPPAASTQPRRARPEPTERQRGEPAPEGITSRPRPRYPDSRHPPGRRIAPERSPGRGVSSPARERSAPGPGVRGGLASERGFTAPPRPGAGAPPRGSSLPGVGAPPRGSSLPDVGAPSRGSSLPGAGAPSKGSSLPGAGAPPRGSSLPGAGAPSRGSSLPAEAEDMALTSAPAPQDAPDSLAAEPLFELPPEPIPTDYSGFNLSGEGPDPSGAQDTAGRGNIRGAPGGGTPAAGGARATSRGAPEETRDAPLRAPGAGQRGRPTREGRRGAPPFGADGEPLRDTEELRRMRDALSYRQAKSVTMLAAEAGLSLHTARAALGLLALYGEAADNGEGWRLLRGRAAG